MDWLQRQIDEIVSSLGDLPDIRVVLPELSGITDTGWMKSLGSDLGDAYRGGIQGAKQGQKTSST